MYFAALISLLGMCGVPALIAAGILFVAWLIYASTVHRK